MQAGGNSQNRFDPPGANGVNRGAVLHQDIESGMKIRRTAVVLIFAVGIANVVNGQPGFYRPGNRLEITRTDGENACDDYCDYASTSTTHQPHPPANHNPLIPNIAQTL